MSENHGSDRRTFLKTTGAAAAGASLLPFVSGGVASASSETGDATLDPAFELASGLAHEALVVFDSRADVDRLGTLDLIDGYYAFDVLPIGYATLTTEQLRTVADWSSVRFVRKNVELDYYNDDAREVTEADRVQNDLGYGGDGVHVAVIDSGIDGDHPDLRSSLVANWQWAGNPLGSPTLWTEVGDADTDTIGHGTHVSGSIAGSGDRSGGQFEGMAPKAALTMYGAGETLFVLKAAAAYDHLLRRVRDGKTDVTVVSNSYGSSNGERFHPDYALNVATWNAHREGLLSAFAAGNAGPDTNTLNQYAKAPHVLGVAATTDDRRVTSFSSRGRRQGGDAQADNWDRELALDNLREYYDTGSASGPLGVYRPGIGAPGNLVVSTMSPTDALQAESASDGRLWYAAISGTSMATPMIAGVAALVADAYRANNAGDVGPTELLTTLAAEAADVYDSYTPYNVGTGFVDAYQSAVRAENGNLASFSDVTLVE